MEDAQTTRPHLARSLSSTGESHNTASAVTKRDEAEPLIARL